MCGKEYEKDCQIVEKWYNSAFVQFDKVVM